jgi:outer membrane lipoprotein carrier protein
MPKHGIEFSRNVVFAAVLLCAMAARSLGQTSVSEFAARVDEHYNHMHTLRAKFAEEYQGTGTARSEAGTLILKKPGKMRWEYNSPRAKLFITDGKTAYFYVPGEQQVRKQDVKNLDDLRSPLRYLLGKTKLEKELANLSFASGPPAMAAANRILQGVPKAMGDQISDVQLEITPSYEIVRILMHESDGSKTEFRFSNLEENAEAGDYLFQFAPPRGVEVFEGSSFAP